MSTVTRQFCRIIVRHSEGNDGVRESRGLGGGLSELVRHESFKIRLLLVVCTILI